MTGAASYKGLNIHKKTQTLTIECTEERNNSLNSCDRLDEYVFIHMSVCIYIYIQLADVYLLWNNHVFKLSEQCLLDSLFLIIHCVNRLEQVSQIFFSNICFHENGINLISIIGSLFPFHVYSSMTLVFVENEIFKRILYKCNFEFLKVYWVR